MNKECLQMVPRPIVLQVFWKIGNFILGTKQFSSELAKVYATDCTKPSLIVCSEYLKVFSFVNITYRHPLGACVWLYT